MVRDARVYRDRHGRGPRGVTSGGHDAVFTAAVASALQVLDARLPASMLRVTVAIEDRPSAADLELAHDHVPAGRVMTSAGEHVVTIFQEPIMSRSSADGNLSELVTRELETLVLRALSR